MIMHVAPIGEDGEHTIGSDGGDVYKAIQDAITKVAGAPPILEPPPIIKRSYGAIAMPESVPLLGAIKHLASCGPHAVAAGAKLPTMEMLNQSFGFIMYERADAAFAANTSLTFTGRTLFDRAQIFVDGVASQVVYRDKVCGCAVDGPGSTCSVGVPSGTRLQVLVENMGRINFGNALSDERKGINDSPPLPGGWTATCLDMNAVAVQSLPFANRAEDAKSADGLPVFRRGTLHISGTPADTYFDTKGLRKGLMWVNGVNLGRYWEELGPQHALYCPAPFLTRGDNTIIILDLGGAGSQGVTSVSAQRWAAPGNATPPIPTPPPVEPCSLQCYDAGRCCQGNQSSSQVPSCAMGCLASRQTSSLAACVKVCEANLMASPHHSPCNFVVPGLGIVGDTCQMCPCGCRPKSMNSSDASDCIAGCVFGSKPDPNIKTDDELELLWGDPPLEITGNILQHRSEVGFTPCAPYHQRRLDGLSLWVSPRTLLSGPALLNTTQRFNEALGSFFAGPTSPGAWRLKSDDRRPPIPAPASLSGTENIPVLHPSKLPAAGIQVLDRTPLGILGDFKPDIVVTNGGDLLIVAGTCAGGLSGHDPPSYSAKNLSGGYCSRKINGISGWPHNDLFRSTGGETWSECVEKMLGSSGRHGGGEETTLGKLADGALLALGNGGASVFTSRDDGNTWNVTLNQTQLTAMSCPIGWDGNSLAYGVIEIAEDDTRAGTLPAGAYIFSGERVLRSTDNARSFAVYGRAVGKNGNGTTLARGHAFFEQSELFLRKDGTLMHGTRSSLLARARECHLTSVDSSEATCNQSSWRWAQMPSCLPPCAPSTQWKQLTLDGHPGALKPTLGNRSCDPAICRQACCDDPKCQAWVLAVEGHIPDLSIALKGCNTWAPCCFLRYTQPNATELQRMLNTTFFIASGERSGMPPGPPPPAPPALPLPPESQDWSPFLPVKCGGCACGFGRTVQLSDGTLVTPYSYVNASVASTRYHRFGTREAKYVDCNTVFMAVISWRLPADSTMGSMTMDITAVASALDTWPIYRALKSDDEQQWLNPLADLPALARTHHSWPICRDGVDSSACPTPIDSSNEAMADYARITHAFPLSVAFGGQWEQKQPWPFNHGAA
eukprot:SAG11_NODE_569_length_8458_cov_5.574231_4_plen_1120_part_00